ncbi:transcriptional repressor NrdR [bacterium]|nr:transcriptional repressor NrdR [bacterium]
MRCTQCQQPDTRVLESREVDDGRAIRRRRLCNHCGARFTSYERVELPRLLVVKKSGEREQYDREKLARGIYRAAEKRPISAEQIEDLVSNIERDVYARGESELSTQSIGEMVMEALASLDEVAYVRFASVYRSFTSAESFRDHIAQLKRSTRRKST